MRQEEVARNAAPKKNRAVLPITLVALVMIALGAGYYLVLVKPHNEKMDALAQAYSLHPEYISKNVQFSVEENELVGLDMSLVAQSAPPKPKPKPGAGHKKPTTGTTAAQPEKKPSLLGGGGKLKLGGKK